MPLDATTVSVIRAGMDVSNYLRGVDQLITGNQRVATSAGQSSDQVVASQTRATRAVLDGGGALEKLRREAIAGYSAMATYITKSDQLNRALELGRTDASEAANIAAFLATKYLSVAEAAAEAAAQVQRFGQTANRFDIHAMIGAQVQGVGQIQANAARVASVQGVVNQFADVRPQYRAAEDPSYAVDLSSQLAARDAKLQAELNPLIAITAQYEAALERVNTAERLGVGTTLEHAAARQRATAAYEAAIAANRAFADSIDPTIIAQNRAAGFQTHINAVTGVQPPPTDEAHTARAADIAAYGTQLDNLRAKYNPLFRVSKQYETTLNEISEAEKLGALSAREAEAARERATAAFAAANAPLVAATGNLEKHTTAAWANRFALQQTGVQTVQFFSSIQAGQPILTAFIQQGHQMVDIMLATGIGVRDFAAILGRAFAAIGRFAISPIGIGIEATAGLATLGYLSESSERRLHSLSTQLRATHDDYGALGAQAEAAAKHLAATTPLGTTEARAATHTITLAPEFQGNQQQLEALVLAASDAAKVFPQIFGKDVEEAAKKFTEAFNDPARVVQEMADRHLKGFGQALVDRIKDLQNAGHAVEGFNLLLDELRKHTQGATEPPTALAKAWEDLKETLTGTGQSARTAGESIGDAIVFGVTKALEAVNGLFKALRDLREEMGHFLPWAENYQPGPRTPQTALPPGKSAFGIARDWIFGPDSGSPLQPGPGAITRSPAGALGIMQLMPDTAAQLHVNPFLPDENVQGGMRYIQQLSQQFHSVNDIAGAYNAGPTGYTRNPGVASGYISSVASADISRLPTDVASRIAYWGQALGLPPDLIALGQRIAVVESGGHQYRTPAATAPGGIEPTFATSPAAAYGVGAVTSTGLADIDPVSKALKEVDSLNLISDAHKKLLEVMELVNAGRAEAEKRGDTAAYARLTKGLQDIEGELYRTITPQESFLRQLEQQAKLAPIVTEGDRKIAEALQQLNQLNKEHPESAFGDAEKAKVINAVLEIQSGEYKKISDELAIATVAQMDLAAAYGQGSAAVAQATARAKAYVEAIKMFPKGAQRDAAVTALTEQYVKLDEAQNKASIAKQTATNNDQLTILQAETAAITMNSGERALMLARMQAEIELRNKNIPLLSTEGQAYLASVEAITKQRTALEETQASVQALEAPFESAFDKIGDAIAGGTRGAQAWRNIMQSIVDDILKMFIKLGIINPLLNELFGGQTRPTLGSALGGLSGSGGGSLLGSILGSGNGTIGNPWDTATQAGGAPTPGTASPGLLGSIGSGEGPLGGLFKLFSGGGGGSNPWDTATSAGTAAASSGGGGILGSFFDLFHAGGVVGEPGGMTRWVPQAMFDDAPRYHSGLGNDEFAAILQRGERVLTANQNDRMERAMAAFSDRSGPTQASNVVPLIGSVHFHGTDLSDKRSAQRTEAQASALLARAVSRTAARNT
jgi:soluble lytic murein transglycosylase-like protein